MPVEVIPSRCGSATVRLRDGAALRRGGYATVRLRNGAALRLGGSATEWLCVVAAKQRGGSAKGRLRDGIDLKAPTIDAGPPVGHRVCELAER